MSESLMLIYDDRALLQCSLLIGNLIGYLVLPSSSTISGMGLA